MYFRLSWHCQFFDLTLSNDLEQKRHELGVKGPICTFLAAGMLHKPSRTRLLLHIRLPQPSSGLRRGTTHLERIASVELFSAAAPSERWLTAASGFGNWQKEVYTVTIVGGRGGSGCTVVYTEMFFHGRHAYQPLVAGIQTIRPWWMMFVPPGRLMTDPSRSSLCEPGRILRLARLHPSPQRLLWWNKVALDKKMKKKNK